MFEKLQVPVLGVIENMSYFVCDGCGKRHDIFSSGTAEQVVVVESTMLLPLVFLIVAALFATLAQRMGREMATLPPLAGYTLNLLGSLAGVGLFAGISWLHRRLRAGLPSGSRQRFRFAAR
jgi:hypothetical protein